MQIGRTTGNYTQGDFPKPGQESTALAVGALSI